LTGFSIRQSPRTARPAQGQEKGGREFCLSYAECIAAASFALNKMTNTGEREGTVGEDKVKNTVEVVSGKGRLTRGGGIEPRPFKRGLWQSSFKLLSDKITKKLTLALISVK